MVFASFAASSVGEEGRVTRITDELGVVTVDGDFETEVETVLGAVVDGVALLVEVR